LTQVVSRQHWWYSGEHSCLPIQVVSTTENILKVTEKWMDTHVILNKYGIALGNSFLLFSYDLSGIIKYFNFNVRNEKCIEWSFLSARVCETDSNLKHGQVRKVQSHYKHRRQLWSLKRKKTFFWEGTVNVRIYCFKKIMSTVPIFHPTV
jgi:hypothetical protein